MSIHSRASLCEASNSPYFDGAGVTLVAKSQAEALALALALFDALELYSGRSLRPSPKTCLNVAMLRVLADAKAITKAMPAKDLFHDAGRHALEKQGWIITDNPLHLDFGGVEIYIDLGAEKLLAAERNG
jgi:hypothetical protein